NKFFHHVRLDKDVRFSGAQAEGRKFGGSFLLGYHGASQLRTTYGYDGATKLSNLASTRLFLRQPEEADASTVSI
ncbi:MAG: hypothetical protein EBU03_04315, partial [Methylophilaceae bacterium]|nr:hypothetical protein [Methylophilaceae bacterium]